MLCGDLQGLVRTVQLTVEVNWSQPRLKCVHAGIRPTMFLGKKNLPHSTCTWSSFGKRKSLVANLWTPSSNRARTNKQQTYRSLLWYSQLPSSASATGRKHGRISLNTAKLSEILSLKCFDRNIFRDHNEPTTEAKNLVTRIYHT